MCDEEQQGGAGSSRGDRAPAPDLTPEHASADTTHDSPPPARRDENPFSFRHFLRREGSGGAAGNTYERTGARPKTYGASTPPGPAQAYERPPPRPAADPLGLPSLPDFVQDHLLVEQAYLAGVAGGVDLHDLHHLPDFTESAPHLTLDLTDHQHHTPHRVPTELGGGIGGGGGGECPRLPDFLPANPGRSGRSSPDPTHTQLQRLQIQLNNARAELSSERTRSARLERELHEARALHVTAGTAHVGAGEDAGALDDEFLTVEELRAEIKRLRESETSARREAESLRAVQAGAARSLRQATHAADASLRELLGGLERLRSLSSTLEPP